MGKFCPKVIPLFPQLYTQRRHFPKASETGKSSIPKGFPVLQGKRGWKILFFVFILVFIFIFIFFFVFVFVFVLAAIAYDG